MSDRPRSGRVVVIGAGFAGLAAAWELARLGSDPIVIEARDRVGGRVWSERIAGGALVERGGEFITAGYETTERLAGLLGIELDGMGIRYPEREVRPDPRFDRRAALEAAAAAAERAAREPAGTARELLEQAVGDPGLRSLLGNRVQSARAHPLDRLDGRFLLTAADLLGNAETRRLRGGNQRLATELAADLPRPVELGSVAREVRHGPDGVTVAGPGLELEAEACVVTIPLATYPSLRFDPPLPAGTARALAAIPVGAAAKLFVPLRTTAPARAVMSASRPLWGWVTSAGERPGSVVASWAATRPQLDRLEVESGPERWTGELGRLWPELELAPEAAEMTLWERDRWARGAYSVLPPVETDLATAASTSGSPRLVLAGEHTAPAGWTGTMEGALRSGLHAALKVREALSS